MSDVESNDGYESGDGEYDDLVDERSDTSETYSIADRQVEGVFGDDGTGVDHDEPIVNHDDHLPSISRSWASKYFLQDNYAKPTTSSTNRPDILARQIQTMTSTYLVDHGKAKLGIFLVTNLTNEEIRESQVYEPLSVFIGNKSLFLKDFCSPQAIGIYQQLVKRHPTISIYFVIQFSKINAIKLQRLYSEIEKTPELFACVSRLFIITTSSVSPNYYDTDRVQDQSGQYLVTKSDRFVISKMFPTYTIRTPFLEYDMRVSTTYHVGRGQLSIHPQKTGFIYECFHRNRSKHYVPDAISSVLLWSTYDEQLTPNQDKEAHYGLVRLLQCAHPNQSQTQEKWRKELKYIFPTPTPFTIPKKSILEEFVKKGDQAQERIFLQQELQSNVLYYEEMIKDLFLSSSTYSVREGEKASRDPMIMAREKIREAAEAYFTIMLDNHPEILSTLKAMVLKKREVFYFPHLYHHHDLLYEFIQDATMLREYQFTSFVHQHLLTETLGNALHQSVMNKVEFSAYSSFIINDTILSKSREIAAKLSVFRKEGMRHQQWMDIIHVLIECDEMTHISIPSSILSTLMVQLADIEKGAFSDESHNEFLIALYQYSYYYYKTCEQLIRTNGNMDVDETHIAAYSTKLQEQMRLPYTIPSRIFPHGVNGCIVEACFEFLILHCDINGKTRLTKDDIRAFQTDLLTYIRLQDVSLADRTILPWLNHIVVASLLQRNHIEVPMNLISTITDMMYMIVSQYRDARKPLFHHFTRQFCGRGNIQHGPLSIEEPIQAEYAIDRLLEEQHELRISFSEVPDSESFALQALKGEQDSICSLLSSMEMSLSDRELYTFVNRMNLIKRILQGLDKTVRDPLLTPFDASQSMITNAIDRNDRIKRLYQLHQYRSSLLLSDQQASLVHRELFEIRKFNVMQRLSVSDSIFKMLTNQDGQIITILLQSLRRYDLFHLNLFYSIMEKSIELSDPRKIFEFHPSTLVLNMEQHFFLTDLMEHLVWLQKINFLEDNNVFFQLISKFFQANKPLYHVVSNEEYDSYYPFSQSTWIMTMVQQRNQDMKALLEPDSVLYKWAFEHTLAFRIMIVDYQRIMKTDRIVVDVSVRNTVLRELESLVLMIESIASQSSVPELIAYCHELRQHVIRRWTLLSYFPNEALSMSQDMASLEMMMSYFRYGKPTTVLGDILFVKPFESHFLTDQLSSMAQMLTDLKEIQRRLMENSCKGSCQLPAMKVLRALYQNLDELESNIYTKESGQRRIEISQRIRDVMHELQRQPGGKEYSIWQRYQRGVSIEKIDEMESRIQSLDQTLVALESLTKDTMMQPIYRFTIFKPIVKALTQDNQIENESMRNKIGEEMREMRRILQDTLDSYSIHSVDGHRVITQADIDQAYALFIKAVQSSCSCLAELSRKDDTPQQKKILFESLYEDQSLSYLQEQVKLYESRHQLLLLQYAQRKSTILANRQQIKDELETVLPGDTMSIIDIVTNLSSVYVPNQWIRAFDIMKQQIKRQ